MDFFKVNGPKRLLSILTASTLLAGCIAPGSRLPLNNKQVIQTSDNHCLNIACRVKVYPLTPELVSKLRSPLPKTQTNPRLTSEISRYQYRIGVGDIINITVWDHPELTLPAGAYRSSAEAGNWVQADGSIFYPYIGRVYVAHKTIPEVRELIADRLSKYIKDPQVAVSVAAFRSQKAYITGEVKSPGQQPITNIPLTVLDAVNQAGGLAQNVDWRHVTLTHNGSSRNLSLYALMQHGDLSQNALLHNGDIIHIPRDDNQKVFVMGEVRQPQLLKIDRVGMSLSEALARVGGINELHADASGVFVIRPRLKGFDSKDAPIANIFQLNIKDASALVLGTEFEMRPYDVIYVTSAPIELWNRVIRDLLPTISTFNLLRSQILISLNHRSH